VKDNVDVRDMPSTGGNVAFAGSAPPRDATVVAKLRAAGAIILAKTNLDEFALGSQGLSSLGGQIRNVFDPTRSPGGSSGGTAVAVAAAFATAGIATETGQSTRSPAGNAGLVGIVGTRGLVSRAGVIPISFTQDRIGVHARSVADAALLLATIKGFDVEDLQTAASLAAPVEAHYLDDAAAPEVQPRVGILRELFPPAAAAGPGNALVDAALARIRSHATLIDGLSTGLDLPRLVPELRVNNYEVRFAFNAYLKRRGATSPVPSLAALVDSGRYLRLLDSRYEIALKVQSLDTDQEYRMRLRRQAEVRAALLELMERERLDALAYPLKSLTAPALGEAEVGGPRDNPFSSVSGLPAVVLPVGLHPDGLPIAIELLGRPFREGALLRLAASYERVRGPRPLPVTTPALPGDRFSY
jgi:amidase